MGAIIGPEKAEIGWGVHVHCLEKKAKTWRCFPSWNINVLSVKAAMGQCCTGKSPLAEKSG